MFKVCVPFYWLLSGLTCIICTLFIDGPAGLSHVAYYGSSYLEIWSRTLPVVYFSTQHILGLALFEKIDCLLIPVDFLIFSFSVLTASVVFLSAACNFKMQA